MIIEKQVIFEASEEKVWDLLTNPKMTKQYMFGCEVHSDWKVGDSINWIGTTEEGKEIVYVKGEIVAIEEGRKVTLTMLDPNIGIADIPKNYAQLTYELASSDKGTLLTIKQNFEGTENAEKRYNESLNGWDMVIEVMKKIMNS